MRMRLVLALLFMSLLIAPGIATSGDDATILHGCEGDGDHDNDGIPNNEDPDCHDHQDSPGIGLVAAIGSLGALAFLARRRTA